VPSEFVRSHALDDRMYVGLDEMAADASLQDALGVVEQAWSRHRYSYNFRWLGVPIIQMPQDTIALQEIIWQTRPTMIIETGIAHGGSLVFYASILRLAGIEGRVVGIDIDLREHNRTAIAAHPLASMLTLVDGDSAEPNVIKRVHALAQNERVMVILDSNHTHDHVLAELRAYSALVAPGCYCCVSDTIVQRIPSEVYHDRPWDAENNPMTAVQEFLLETNDFIVDETIDRKLGLSMSPRGYLIRK
jgi:cephalosporin hydroxylase